MHRRLSLIGTLVLLVCLGGCGFLGEIGGGTGGFAVLAGPNTAAGGTGTVTGIPPFVAPFQQGPPPAQPGVFAGSAGP